MRYKGKRTEKKIRRGSALVLTMMYVLIFSIVVGAILTYVHHQTRMTHRARLVTSSLDGVRSTMDAYANNIVHLATTRPPAQTGGQIDTLAELIHDIQPNATAGMRLVEAPNGRQLAYARDRGPNDFAFRPIENPTHDWYGYTIAELDYELVAAVVEDTPNAANLGYDGAAVRQRVTVSYIPLYQFAIFYDPILELHPGPTMDVLGRVHSNIDLYLSAVNRIRFHSRTTSAGNFYRWTGEGGGQGGVVEFKVPRDINDPAGPFDWVDMGENSPIPQPDNGDGYFDSRDTELWFQGALDRWKGQVLDQAHGIQPIRPPLPTGAQMHELIQRASSADSPELRTVKFETSADLLITGDPGDPSTISIYTQTVNESGDRMLTPMDQSLVDAIVSIGQFYDGQIQSIVRTLDVDISQIYAFAQATDFFEEPGRQGMIYVSTTPGEADAFALSSNNTDPDYLRDEKGEIVFNLTTGRPLIRSGGNPGWMMGGLSNYMPAVRVVNAQRLPSNSGGGFGFYTDRPLYTVGDINTQGTRVTAVFGGDSLTVTAYKQRLATIDSNGNGFPDSDGAGRIAEGFTRNLGDNWQSSGYSWDVNNTNWDVYQDGSNAQMQIRDKVRARNTTTNCIFLMGNTPPVINQEDDSDIIWGSGGAHNVMRYLENWSGRTHSLSGSMIVLFHSQVAVHKYRCCGNKGYYEPPNRNYQWDSSLQTSEPPPGMPTFIEIKKWEMETVPVEYAIANTPED